MNCPECNSINSRIIDSRYHNEVKKRRRECQNCFERWTTHEMIVKESGTQRIFEAKIRVGKREMVIGTYETIEEAQKAEMKALGALSV